MKKMCKSLMFKLLMIPAIAWALVACSTATTETVQQTAEVTLAAAEVAYQFDEGNVVGFVNAIPLTPEEQQVIDLAVEQADASVLRIKSQLTTPEGVLGSLILISEEYTKIKYSYIKVKEIVKMHEADYPAEAWIEFVRFDNAIQTLNDNYLQMAARAKTQEVLINTLRTAAMVSRLAG